MEIKVSNVSFIQDDQYILKDITCTILPRRVTCLMGISGSGAKEQLYDIMLYTN